MEPDSDRISAARLEMEAWEKERVAKVFAPELRAKAAASRSAAIAGIDVLASAEAWDRMRRHGQSTRAARQVLRLGILSLLGAA